MRTLFEMDKKNYDSSGKVFYRPSVRSIIIRGGRVAMVHSLMYDYYKFPGGGIESGETRHPEPGAQKLDDYEARERFTLEFVEAEHAIDVNRNRAHGPKNQTMLEREARVLEMLREEGYLD